MPPASDIASYPVELYYGPTPNPTPLSTPSDDERWTNELPEDIAADSKVGEEHQQDAKETSVPDNDTSSAARFRERTEIFEKLLEFLPPDSKQPSENLLDLMDISGDP